MTGQNHLSCSCTYETIADSGEVINKTNVKNADLVIGRNDYGALVLFVSRGKTKEVFLLNSFTVHNKFLNEGKASITLPLQKRRIMIFNSPSEKLFDFLKLLYVKNEVAKEGPKSCKPLRQKALMSLKTSFSDVSPLTAKDLNILNRSQNSGAQVKRKAEITPQGKENTPMKGKTSNTKKDSIKPKAKRQLQMLNQNVSNNHSSITNTLSPASDLLLSCEQTRILEAVKAGNNVFITGSAGTGKSFILNKIIRSSPPDSTFVTASTGLAACHIRGTTIHSFAGIGSGKGGLEECLRLASKAPVQAQWKACRLLIVDEISMISGDYFEKIEITARTIRKNAKPFGGIQLVLCGDFLQLPPIVRAGETRAYAFQSSAWQRCRLQSHQLRQVRRQKDPVFAALLDKLRLGICTSEMEKVLKATSSHHSSHSHLGIVATRLCTHKEDVDNINHQQLAKLASVSKTFSSHDHPSTATTLLDNLFPTPSSLVLKVGAQVMITKNVNVAGGLVNGARGVVVALQSKDNGGPIVRLLSGVEHVMPMEKWVLGGVGGVQMVRRQFPLRLAWAISIHKSQGMTLDHVEVSLSKVFEAGQAYVALSRASSLAGLKVSHFEGRCIRADQEVLSFYRGLHAAAS